MAWSRAPAALLGVPLAAATFAIAGWVVGGARAAPPDEDQPRVETWSGGEAFDRIWSVYAGASFAPFGSVREDGFRLRAVVGYGDHGSGTVSFADLLGGYHVQLGPVTLKVFAGLAAAHRQFDQPGSPPQGIEMGAKGVAEVWWNITDQVWTSADLSAASLHSLYSARIRLGWRLWPELSSGFEGGSAGTADHDIARFGGFLRYEWATGELSLSAGVAMDGPNSHWEGSAGPFGTLSVLMRF